MRDYRLILSKQKLVMLKSDNKWSFALKKKVYVSGFLF